MKTINVFLYFYKNKNILNIVKLLNDKSSKKNKIIFDIYDQDNEKKDYIYSNIENVSYNHIFWDRTDGVYSFRNKSLENNFDYFLEIKNIIDIDNFWDEKLINCSNNSVCITGNEFPDMNLIFIDKQRSVLLKGLSKLKFYGQDLKLYHILYQNNIKTTYIKNTFATFNKDTILLSDYVPYSLYNDYNKNIKEIKDDYSFLEYCKINDIDINKYKTLSYQIDDLNYENLSYTIDSFQSEKFRNPIKIIKKNII